MTHNLFHSRFRETRDFGAWNHIFPHSFSQYELSCFLIADNHIHLSFCFPRIFFLTAWLYHFEWCFTGFFKEFLTLLQPTLIPFRVATKQLFHVESAGLRNPQKARCQVCFLEPASLLPLGIVSLVLLSRCLRFVFQLMLMKWRR